MTGFHIVWTVLLVIVFVGIVAWAFSGRRKSRFEEAARLPLEDDGAMPPQGKRRENGDG
jgi:cytochrome c oxidase cbb3-type subunit IV